MHTLIKIKKPTVVVAIWAYLFLLCCGAGTIDEKGLFRYRINSDPPTLDPAHCTDTVSASIILKIFDGLVQFDEKTLEVIPAVAKAWTISPDGLVYTFILRDDVRFHNGRRVVAGDFKYSFERTLNPTVASERRWVLEKLKGAEAYTDGTAASITGVDAIDDTTLKLTLSMPYAPFLAQLCMEAANVVPREEVEKVGHDKFTQAPVGCGPFKFVHWQPDNEIMLEANPDYYGEASGDIQKLVYKVITNVNVALEAYKNGELDFLDEVPTGQVKSLQASHKEDVHTWPTLGTFYFGFDHRKAPFKGNVALRQALNYAIDKEKICKVIYEGVNTPARGILPPGLAGEGSREYIYPYDLGKARQLLSDAGYPKGKGLPEITLWYNTNESHQRVCQFVQAALKEIGVRVQLKNLDWAAYLKALEAGEATFYRLGWVADVPDADNFLYILLNSRQHGAPGNFSRYSNPEFDAITEKARSLSDPKERGRLYATAEKMAVEDACWLITHHYGDVVMVKPKWQNVILSRQGDFTMPIRKLRLGK